MSAEQRVRELEAAIEQIGRLAAPYADPRSNIVTHHLASQIMRVVWATQEQADEGNQLREPDPGR